MALRSFSLVLSTSALCSYHTQSCIHTAFKRLRVDLYSGQSQLTKSVALPYKLCIFGSQTQPRHGIDRKSTAVDNSACSEILPKTIGPIFSSQLNAEAGSDAGISMSGVE